MTVKKFGRRMFLGAAGGSLLAMPWLPSLLTNNAHAAADKPSSFISFNTGHGGILPQQFFPDVATLDRTQNVLSWEARWSELSSSTQGGRRRLSDVVQAESSRFSEDLAQKMGFLMGVDYTPGYIGHHIASHLGGYAQELNRIEKRAEFKPTLDQIIGNSKAMYPTAPSQGVIGINHTNGSWYHAIPGDKSSPIVSKPGYNSPRSLWFSIFQPGGSTTINSRRDWAVDRAVESYKRLTNGSSTEAKRLSSQDRQRLEMHMNGLFEIQGRIERSKTCEQLDTPDRGFSGSSVRDWETYAAIIQRAITCGISRVFNINTSSGGNFFPSIGGNFHEQVAHRAAFDPSSQQGQSGTTDQARENHMLWYRYTFERSILPILNALNTDDGMGNNILDESFVLWTSECGAITHSSIGIPLMTAGSLGGKLETGRFIDFRNLNDTSLMLGRDRPKILEPFWKPGLPYDQLLGTILQGFGIPLEDYDSYRLRDKVTKPGETPEGAVKIGGYGGYLNGGVADRAYKGVWVHPEEARLGADSPLPLLWKG